MKKAEFKLLLVLTVCILLGLYFGLGRVWLDIRNCSELSEWIVSQGWLGPIFYVFFATLFLMVFVPRTLLIILAGICFGLGWGTIWAMLASMVASVATFYLARRFGRTSIERLFKKRKWFSRLESLSHSSGINLVLVARATHLLNFCATNWVCGVLDIKGWSFIWGTFFGTLPGTIILIYASKILGCQIWEGKTHLTSELVYLLVITSIIMVLTSAIPLWLGRKKSR